MSNDKLIAYKKTSQRNAPSPDKGDVGKWILAPSWLATFCGLAAGAGIAMAMTASKDYVFIIGLGMFGGGMSGLVTIMLKSLSFDRDGVVSWSEETPILYDNTVAEEPPLNGRRPHYVARQSGAEVAHGDQTYKWSDTQINAMLNRIDANNMQVARDPFVIAPSDYQKVQYIMAGRGYWTKPGNAITWTPTGIIWLRDQVRNIARPTLD
jgi:hypothetical protein